MHVIFSRKIFKKTRKITRTKDNYVNEYYVHGTVCFYHDIASEHWQIIGIFTS